MKQAFVDNLWYGQNPLRWILWPFSLVFQVMARIRRIHLVKRRQQNVPVPVIVVGNLTVGGVGKTPLVIALVKAFQDEGLRVGVVSRGYGATLTDFPHEVQPGEQANQVGDEPLLIATRCHCPVVIAPKRMDAVHYLLEKHQSQIIISDDGLQHYAMGRSIEVVVIDGQRGLGNGLCLPAGPLREPKARLRQADFIVVNEGEWPGAYSMTLEPTQWVHLASGNPISFDDLPNSVAAVAAIGHPKRFYTTLQNLGMTFSTHSFPDHHKFESSDFNFSTKAVVMTEKDAVKCQSFAAENWYFLSVNAKLSSLFWQALWSHDCLKDYKYK